MEKEFGWQKSEQKLHFAQKFYPHKCIFTRAQTWIFVGLKSEKNLNLCKYFFKTQNWIFLNRANSIQSFFVFGYKMTKRQNEKKMYKNEINETK